MNPTMDRSSGQTPDGCEWNPENDSPSYDDDEHYRTTQATLIVGADGQWRLCDSCAKLKHFKRFRVRKRIRLAKAQRKHIETQRADSGTGTPEAETVGSEPERSPTPRMTEDRLEELEYHAASQNAWEDWGKLEEAVIEIRLSWADIARYRRDADECERWQLRFYCPRHGNKDWGSECRCDLKDTGIE